MGGVLRLGEHSLLNALGVTADGHERIAQLVRDVLEEVLLHPVAALKAAGHLVHGQPQLLQLAYGKWLPDFGEISRPNPPGLAAKPLQRAAYGARREPQDGYGRRGKESGDE